MKKVIVLFTFIIFSFIILSGCSRDNNLSLGVYGAGNEADLLRLTIEKEQRFTIAVPVLSIMPSTGSYEIKDTNLILTTDDNSTVVFTIEGKSLIFNQSSSSFSENEYPALKALADGETFEMLSIE
jgi:hypothetical protein